jgi:hypothetical protein
MGADTIDDDEDDIGDVDSSDAGMDSVGSIARKPLWFSRFRREKSTGSISAGIGNSSPYYTSRGDFNLDISRFHKQIDILDNYKPWYSHLPNPFRKKKVAKMTEILAGQ